MLRPRKIFINCKNINLINSQEFEIAEKMISARNETVHTYDEELADGIAKDIPKYFKLMQNIMSKINLDFN